MPWSQVPWFLLRVLSVEALNLTSSGSGGNVRRCVRMCVSKETRTYSHTVHLCEFARIAPFRTIRTPLVNQDFEMRFTIRLYELMSLLNRPV